MAMTKDRVIGDGKRTLKELENYDHNILFTSPNADAGSDQIKKTIDQFINCMIEISELSKIHPEEIINAPINLPVERLDEALAARNPILSWKQ